MSRRGTEESLQEISNYDELFRSSSGKKNATGSIMGALLKSNRWKIILSTFLFFIKTLPEWVAPLITADIIDVATNWAKNPDVNRLIIDGVTLIVVVMTNIPTHIWNARVNDRMIRATSVSLKTTIVRKLQSLSLTYHRELESGKVQSKFLRDTENTESLFRQIVAVIIPTCVSVIASCTIALTKSPIIMLFFLVTIPANVIVTTIYYRTMRKGYGDLRVQNERVSSKMARMLEMYPITKAHGLEQNEYHDFETDAKSLYSRGLRVDRTQASFGSTVWVVEEIFKGLCLLFSVVMALNGVPGFSIGSIVLYQSLFGQINSYVQRLVNVLPNISNGAESLRSLSEIMNSDDIEVYTGKLPVSGVRGNIEFRDVCYRYPTSEEYVIKDFSLNVRAGECVAFVGASGSGKSTLMNMIIGFLKPSSGDILIDGKSVRDINLFEYRHGISVVPQNSILFAGSIRENITYGMTHYTEEELNRALEMSAVTEFLPEMPNGIETNVGERGEKLSGGQRQRVTIARALIRNPSILILDEATSALDNVSEFHVQRAIEQSVKERTTFIVAHRLSTIRNADRIVVMEEGRMVEIGSYDELMEKRGRFFELKNLSDIATKSLEEGIIE